MALATIGDLFKVKNPGELIRGARPTVADVPPGGACFFFSPDLFPFEQKRLKAITSPQEAMLYATKLTLRFNVDGKPYTQVLFCEPLGFDAMRKLLASCERNLVGKGGVELRLIPRKERRVENVLIVPEYSNH